MKSVSVCMVTYCFSNKIYSSEFVAAGTEVAIRSYGHTKSSQIFSVKVEIQFSIELSINTHFLFIQIINLKKNPGKSLVCCDKIGFECK